MKHFNRMSRSSTRNYKFPALSLIAACVLSSSFMTHAFASQNAKINTTKTIIEGTNGPVGSVNGIDFNKFNANDNKLYGVSTVDGKIFSIHSATGKTIDVFGLTEGVIAPDDIAVGPNGDIYYTDTLTGQIKKIDPVTRQSTVITSNLPLINSIRFSTDGNHLYAGQCFNVGGQNGLWEIDLSGNGNNRLISDTLDTSPLLGSLCSLNSFDYKNGFIYGPRIFKGDVVRVNAETGVVDIVASGFINPSAVQFSDNGKLYVTDAANNKLMRIDYPELNNQTPIYVAPLPGSSGVDNLAVKKANQYIDFIYVSSANDGYIAKVHSKTGKVKGFLKKKGIVLPAGLTFASDGNLLLGDYNSLREINPNQQRMVKSTSTKIDLTGTALVRPFSVAALGNYVVLGDWFSRVIQVWDYQNDVQIARIVPANTPINVMGFQGMIISAQYNRITNTATLVQHSGTNYQTATTLATQSGSAFTGLATDGTHIWVADALNGKVYRYDNGALITVAESLSGPEGMALDTDGRHLLVIEVGTKKLSSVNLQGSVGSNVTTVEENLPVGYSNGFALPFFIMTGIAVDSAGKIYYSGDATRVVNRIKRH